MLPALAVEMVGTSMEVYTEHNLQYLRHTAIDNVRNLCGLSVPCGFTSQGLPIGLTIYGKPFQEDLILRIGYAFEQATDWHRRTPDLSWVHG
jgi:aspartyl-tRNA(Asn)/glutamyl-tRNA(Gln) amidotransferase subunit A